MFRYLLRYIRLPGREIPHYLPNSPFFRLAATRKVADWSDPSCFVLKCLEGAYAHPLIEPYKAAPIYITRRILESADALPHRCDVEWLGLIVRHEIRFAWLLPVMESGYAGADVLRPVSSN